MQLLLEVINKRRRRGALKFTQINGFITSKAEKKRRPKKEKERKKKENCKKKNEMKDEMITWFECLGYPTTKMIYQRLSY